MTKLNSEMQKLKDSVLDPDKVKDKVMKLELQKLNKKYDDQLKDLKDKEEAERLKKLQDMDERLQKLKDQIEKKKADFEMLGVFEKKLADKKKEQED